MNKEQNDVITIDLVDEVFKIMNDENFKTFYKNNLVHYKDSTYPENRKYQELIFLYKVINQDRYDKPYTDVVSFDNDNNIILTNEIIKTPKTKETQKKQRIKWYIQPIDQVTNNLFSIDYRKNKNNYFEVIIQNKKGIKSAQKITYNLYEMRNGNKEPAQLDNKIDRVISNVLVSFYHQGIYTMTLEDIYKVSNGAELRTQQQRDEIIQSLLRLSQTFIEIDATNRLKQLKITNMDNKLIGNLVNLTIAPNDENINKTKITILNDGIPFYKYAMLDYKNPMLLSRQNKPKRQPTRGLNQVAYVDFFERHINRHKKQPNIFKPVIILENMFTELQDYEKYINGDMTQRKRIRDTLSKLLKANEKIKSFEWTKENNQITKIKYKLK
jgi:hypothetical protein